MTKCTCGGAEFSHFQGFAGSREEPPEDEGWYCDKCGALQLDDPDAHGDYLYEVKRQRELDDEWEATQ